MHTLGKSRSWAWAGAGPCCGHHFGWPAALAPEAWGGTAADHHPGTVTPFEPGLKLCRLTLPVGIVFPDLTWSRQCLVPG